MTDTKYNGWTNWETWVTNLHFDDAFTEQAQEAWDDAEADSTFTRKENAALALEDIIKETIESYLDESPADQNHFVKDILSGFISSVNFYEIATAYLAEYEDEQEAA